MLVEAAMLCDAAVTRGGLLSILNGGLTQFPGMTFPRPLNAVLAVVLVLEEGDLGKEHEFGASLFAMEHDEQVARCSGRFTDLPATHGANAVNVPVTADLSRMCMPHPGRYEVRVEVDHELLASLPVHAGLGG